MRLLLLCAALLFAASCPALAFDVIYDFDKTSCKDIMAKDPQEVAAMFTWINGYNAGKIDRHTFLSPEADMGLQRFVQYCKTNHNATVMQAYAVAFSPDDRKPITDKEAAK